jgi:hypothetical protein
VVTVEGGPASVTVRWEGDGVSDPEGRSARWRPLHPLDQIRAAVRGRDGVAVVALRGRDVG